MENQKRVIEVQVSEDQWKMLEIMEADNHILTKEEPVREGLSERIEKQWELYMKVRGQREEISEIMKELESKEEKG